MKKLNLILLIALMSIMTNSYAQFKVLSNGDAEISTKLFITKNGNTLRLLPANPTPEIGSSTGEIIFYYSNLGYSRLIAGEMHLRNSSNSPLVIRNTTTGIIGAASGQLDFWYPNYGHQIVVARQYSTSSDSTIKTNIKPLKNAMEIILKTHAYTYNMKNDSILKNEFGYLAQELEHVLPELVSESQEIKVVDYMSMIPIITEAMKEQQKQLETLYAVVLSQEKEIIKLRETLAVLTQDQNQTNIIPVETDENVPQLYQNAPNPFSSETKIKFNIPSSVGKAYIYIHDLQGRQLKVYNLPNHGAGEVTIHASELNPGMYLYSLILDGEIFDTKKMILSNH